MGAVAGGAVAGHGTTVVLTGSLDLYKSFSMKKENKGDNSSSSESNASDLDVVEKGSKEWKNAVESLKKDGKTNVRVKDEATAKELLKESRGNMNRYKQYIKDKGVSYSKGYEVHQQSNSRELGVGNDLPHLNWKDGKGKGHIYYGDKPGRSSSKATTTN